MGRYLGKNEGFALTTILSILVITGIILTSQSALFRNSLKAERTLSGLLEFKNVNRSILQLLSNSKLCAESLKNTNGKPIHYPSEDPFEINLGSERVAYIGKAIGAAIIQGMNFETLSGPTTVGDELEYIAAFKIVAEMQRDTYGSRRLTNSQNPLLLNIRTSQNGEIKSCSADGGGGTIACLTGTRQKNKVKGDEQVFEKYNPPKGKDNYYWGLRCKPGYQRTGCFISQNSGLQGTDDFDLYAAENGCHSDNEEYEKEAVITVICCRT